MTANRDPWAGLTPEERAARVRKIRETRERNKSARLAKRGEQDALARLWINRETRNELEALERLKREVAALEREKAALTKLPELAATARIARQFVVSADAIVQAAQP